jgi:uncharacterized protein
MTRHVLTGPARLAALGAFVALVAVSILAPAAAAQPQGTDVVLAKSIPLDSKILKRTVNILVWVPPGYNQSTARYPVLYDLNTFFSYTYDCGTVEMFSRTTDSPAMIVVGIPQLFDGYVPTPFEQRSDTLAGADRSLAFLRDEVIPLIEANYRTNALRILYGHSVGGLFTMYAMFNYPDMFAGYLAGSPWFQSNDQYWLKNIERFAKVRSLKDKYLYATVGNGEQQLTRDTFTELEKWMKAATLPGLTWRTVWAEGDHGSLSGRTIYDGLLFIFSGWKVPGELVLAADTDAIEAGVRKTLEKWGAFGFDESSIISEAQINSIAYQLIQRNMPDRAMKLFLYNVKRFPKSANAHDSLAEAYMTAGDKANAIQQYKLAVELNSGGTPFEQSLLKNSKDKLRELGENVQ